MNQPHDQQDIWILLEVHEERLSILYNAYSKKFPQYEAFWSSMAEDEIEHARLVRQLSNDKKAVECDKGGLDAQAIETSIGYLNDQISNIRKYDISLKNAFAIAMNFERSLFDGRVYEAFKGRSAYANSILEKLRIGLERHVDMIRKTMAE